MGPAVRLVCIDCLRSIEVSGSGPSAEPDTCPHCGSWLDQPRFDIASRGGPDVASPPTVDLSDASTLLSDAPGGAPVRRVGRFEVRSALGEGGYGQVFRAYDPHLEREVALKVLKPNRLGPKSLERFFREARAAARLDHPNVVGLHDAGQDDGRCWIAYQLVAGRTLSAVRDVARPSVAESVRIVRDLALGLHHAHGRGVFHRDLKPANVMIDDAGRPRLTDFGLARRDDVDSDLTTEGTVLGTPQYMSPEAAAGRAHQADARSDVYSLGVILYELLCGRRPSDLPSGAALWRSAQYSPPATPRSVDRAIPARLDRICMKALAFDPSDRFPDADALARALTEYLERQPRGPAIRAPRPSAWFAAARLGRRGRSLAAVAGLVVLASTILVGWQGFRPVGANSTLAPEAAPQVAPPAAVADAGRPGTLVEAVERRPPDAVEPSEAEIPAPASAPAAEPDPPAAPPVQLVGNDKSRRYHHPQCRYSKEVTRPVLLGSVAEANQRGYRMCTECQHMIRALPEPADPR